MKVKNFGYLLMVFSLLHSSCATSKKNYTNEELIKKYSKHYQIYLDSNRIHLSYTFLDRENIAKIEVDKKTKRITIVQKVKTKLLDLHTINLDSLNSAFGNVIVNKPIELKMIILNGVPLLEDAAAKKLPLLVEQSAIKDFKITSAHKGDVLVISVKN
ncbi:MAG: hypothetical protein ACOVQA_05975 [Thermoflexibacteraceae bacterium]|jgi:hypothetical protein